MMAVQEAPPTKVIRLRGELRDAVLELNATTGEPEVKEILVEGPRGTGKSTGAVAHMLWNWMCEAPGSRWLVVRKTRESLTKTFCPTFEEIIPDEYKSAVIGNALPESRSAYRHPNGSWAGLVGLDKPIKHKGLNIDGVLLEEATELQWKQVEPFVGAIRKFTPGMPFQLLLALTNPGGPKHWLNKRASRGQMKRVRTRHQDNPKWYDADGNLLPEGRAFLKSLERYTGVEYQREVLGLWAAAEGAVWENFDEDIHVIDAPRHADNTPDYNALGLKDYLGSMDWGFTAPGSLSIWGRDGEKRVVRVAAIYRTKQSLEWWAERVCELDTEFGLTRIKCDPSRPDAIALVNDHLSKKGKPRLCEPADNKRSSSPGGDLGGIDLVRWGFEKDIQGVPRIRYLRDSLRFGIDMDLHANDQPTEGWDEIPGYTFARDSEGEILDDRTDPDVPDHHCDEVRYLCAENWNRGAPKAPPIPAFDSGSMGQVYRHADEFKPKRRHRPVWGVR